MKVAVLTAPEQWFVPYAEQLVNDLNSNHKPHCEMALGGVAQNLHAQLLFRHEDVSDDFEIVFILSYHRLISEKFLKRHKHNIVIHASDLPKGKGWAPLFWQVIEGKSEIVFTLFEADAGMDSGDFYLKKTIHLQGHELNHELRHIQADTCVQMCLDFMAEYKTLQPQKQLEYAKANNFADSELNIYKKRGPQDSELDINKTIAEQFNLLRTVDNDYYPAFFYKDGKKYILRIEQDKSS